MIVRLLVCLPIVLATSLSFSRAVATIDLYAAAGIQHSKQGAAPSFVLSTMDGRTIDSSELRGKVVLLNFWATWCGPCKEEMPAMQRLREAFPHADFALLAVTTDQQHDAITAFANGLRLSFPILQDETKDVSAAFGVRGLPTTVILDREGRLVGRAIGPRRWDSPEVIALFKDLLQ